MPDQIISGIMGIAVYLDVSVSTVKRYIDLGLPIKQVKPAYKVFALKKDLDKWLKNQQK